MKQTLILLVFLLSCEIENSESTSSNFVINFNLKKDAFLTLDIYNSYNSIVRNLVKRKFAAGSHSMMWDSKGNKGEKLKEGIYYALIRTDYLTKKITLILSD